MDRRRPRAFTIIEVLMAFGAGTILAGTIYYFYYGLTATNTSIESKIELVQEAEETLEHLKKAFRTAWAVTALYPDRIGLKCIPPNMDTHSGFRLEQKNLLSLEFRAIQGAGSARLIRTEGVQDKTILELDTLNTSVFTGYVMVLPETKDDPVPRFRIFDSISHPTEDLPRITMVKVRLDMKRKKERMEVPMRINLPLMQLNLLQADMNLE